MGTVSTTTGLAAVATVWWVTVAALCNGALCVVALCTAALCVVALCVVALCVVVATLRTVVAA